MYTIISPEKTKRGGRPALGLGEGLTTRHLKKTSCYVMSYRASDLDVWQALVNTVMNIRVPQVENFLTELLLASQEGLCSMELVRRKIIKTKSHLRS
jgi:hypothetical protein